MHRRKPTRAETPIERIYREETGRQMPPSIKRILLHKRTSKRKSNQGEALSRTSRAHSSPPDRQSHPHRLSLMSM